MRPARTASGTPGVPGVPGTPGVPGAQGVPGVRISVVICVYTEERWDDILAAVDSVRTQSLPAQETLLVVDHNTRLLRRLKDHYGDGGAGAAVGGGARADAAVGAAGAYTGAPRDTAGPAR
ncbi:hypothetical protein GA0115260_111126, partial [Streptomyces sp. MnatMP-M27]